MRWRDRCGLLLAVIELFQQPLLAQRSTSPASIAAQYSAAHAGDAVLVYRNDSLIFEQYQNGWKADQSHSLASGTKAFACVLVALAQRDGLIRLETQIAQSQPTITPIDPRSPLAGVTVRQLLNLTSGLSTDQNGQLIRVAAPGQRFAYGGVSFLVFNQLLASKLPDGDVVGYLTRRVFRPLGMTSVVMEPGNLASGAAMTARDWGKFGVLLLQRGEWQGRQLIPAAALAECGKGSDANPYYGMGLWLNPAEPTRPAPSGVQRAGASDRIVSAPDLPHDLLLAAGSGGQRLYILPTQGLVVVRLGHNTGPDYRDEEFLRLLMVDPLH
ncbi:MAG TPA: serine hydrolase [Gemmatimonadales bacterium]|nr:serine hydrolase [Gemmatimonadales bacterium]